MKKYLAIFLSAIMGSALTLGVFKTFDKQEKVYRIEHQTQLPVASTRYNSGVETGTDFTYAAEQVMPAVVHIKSTLLTSNRGRNSQIPDQLRDFFGDDFFGQGYQGQQGKPQPQVGSGSGVLISNDGYIVTNNHVIDQADDIEVSLNDNRTYKAEVIGVDPSTDLALLKIEDKEPFVSVQLGSSEEIRVGEWVLAIGNPFNLNSTVTAGIVSAKGRNIHILKGSSPIESFIQTDAAVNPGNSGGALVNLRGELIGINTAIASPTGSYSGYSFAVPTSIVRKIVEDLMQHGEVQRGFLGVTIRNVDAKFADEKNLEIIDGVYVDSLMENSAAIEGGIKAGDVITAVNGKTVKTSSELIAAVGTKRPGDKVDITVNRNGSTKDLMVTLKNRDGNTNVVKKEALGKLSALGAKFETISAKKAKELGIKGGVIVKELSTGKLRKHTQMEEGFIITKAADQPITSVEELEKIIDERQGKGIMLEGIYENLPGEYYYAFGL